MDGASAHPNGFVPLFQVKGSLPWNAAVCACGLCWSENARDKTIGFLRHGMRRATGPRTRQVPAGEKRPRGRPRKAPAAPSTPEARIAALPQSERDRIASAYGAKVKETIS